MVGLLDRAAINLLQRYGGLARVVSDRILLPIELSIVALAIPMHLEAVCRHGILHGALEIVAVKSLLLPRAGNGVRTCGSSGNALRGQVQSDGLFAGVACHF